MAVGEDRARGDPRGTWGTESVVQGWGSLPREQGCESHQEYEEQQGCILQPMSWDNRPHHRATCAVQLLFLGSGRDPEEDPASQMRG